MHIYPRHLLAAAAASALLSGTPAAVAAPFLEFTTEWRHYASATQNVDQVEVFDESAAEIVAHDVSSQRVFVVNGDVDRIDVLDAGSGTWLGSLNVSGFGSPNSVAVSNGVVAVAVENANAQANGSVVFFSANDATVGAGGTSTGNATVGAMPDMVTFTPDGSKVVVANEGEPDFYGEDGTDPDGSVSIVDISGGVGSAVVSTATFTGVGFDRATLLAEGVRLTGPASGNGSGTDPGNPGLATPAQDIEPEYISVSADGTKAFVTLQENNAVAVVDLETAEVTEVHGLALKDHGAPGNGLDASDRDDAINIQTWAGVNGMPMPDTIDSYEAGGKTYFVTANEGDSREYEVPDGSSGFDWTDEIRVKDIADPDPPFPGLEVGTLDSSFDPFTGDEALGRLQVSRVAEDGSVPDTYVELQSYGTRSFSIWDAETGDLVWDSGDFFEEFTAGLGLFDQDGNPVFNSDNADYDSDSGEDDTNRSFDSRSDAKGPEPEALVLGQVLDSTLAFVGLERIGGIMIFDITDPASPEFITYLLDRNFLVDGITTEALDLGPEGFAFVSAEDSPFGTWGLVVGSEVSGTTTWYSIEVPVPAPLALFAAGLPLMLLRRKR